MKTPDPTGDPARRLFALTAEPGPRRSEEREEEEFRPRYVSLPMRRSRGHGFRNLIWGVGLFVLSSLLLAWGLYLAGPGAAFTVTVSLATAATLYVVARARLLRQRNGNFLAAGIVCLLAVGLVLLQQAWLHAVAHRENPALQAKLAQAPSSPAPVAAKPAPLPALIEEFPPAPEEVASGQVGVMIRPTKVEFMGKRWLLRVGDVFPVNGTSETEVKLAIGAEELKVPASAMSVKTIAASGPAPAAPAEEKGKEDDRPKSPAEIAAATETAQKEAARRYPALAVKGSPENESFVAAWRELKFGGGSSFFDDADWPIRLAEMLASREGWTDAQGVRKEQKFSPSGEDAQRIEVAPPNPATVADSEERAPATTVEPTFRSGSEPDRREIAEP